MKKFMKIMVYVKIAATLLFIITGAINAKSLNQSPLNTESSASVELIESSNKHTTNFSEK